MKFIYIVLFALLFGITSVDAALHTETHTYILSKSTAELIIIDRKTNEDKILNLDPNPDSFYIHNTKGYIFYRMSEKLACLDLKTHEIISTDHFITSVQRLTFNEKYVYALRTQGVLEFFDLERCDCTKRLAIAQGPSSMTVLGKYGYILHKDYDLLTIVDLEKQKVVKSFETQHEPTQLLFHNNVGYLVCESSDVISVFCPYIQDIKTEIDVGSLPSNFTIEGQYGYCLNKNGNSVSVIDLKTLQVIDTIHVGQNPRAIAFDRAYIYVLCKDSDELSIINRESLYKVKSIKVAPKPKTLILKEGYAFVISAVSKYMTIIDLEKKDIVSQTYNGTDLEFDVSDLDIYLGKDKMERIDLSKMLVLFDAPYQGLEQNWGGYPNAAYDTFVRFCELGDFKQAKNAFHQALSLEHPRAHALAAYAFLSSKWGAKDQDFTWYREFIQGADLAFFKLLCANHDQIKFTTFALQTSK